MEGTPSPSRCLGISGLGVEIMFFVVFLECQEDSKLNEVTFCEVTQLHAAGASMNLLLKKTLHVALKECSSSS
jgi:hypothetical protein